MCICKWCINEMMCPELIRWGLWDCDSSVKPAAQYWLAVKNSNEMLEIIRKGIENEKEYYYAAI